MDTSAAKRLRGSDDSTIDGNEKSIDDVLEAMLALSTKLSDDIKSSRDEIKANGDAQHSILVNKQESMKIKSDDIKNNVKDLTEKVSAADERSNALENRVTITENISTFKIFSTSKKSALQNQHNYYYYYKKNKTICD